MLRRDVHVRTFVEPMTCHVNGSDPGAHRRQGIHHCAWDGNERRCDTGECEEGKLGPVLPARVL